MRHHALAILPLALLIACNDSGFKGKSSIAETTAPAEVAPKEIKKEADAKEEDSGDYKQCLLAVGGDVTSVVSVSHGDVDVSKLTPNSVLYLNVQGQAKIDLTASEISSLKGVCISAAGQAALTLDLNATVSALYYYGRGEATTTLNFREQGTLAKLQTDLAGGSRLSLSGEKLACDALKLQKAGSAKVDCNGASL
jgi:hypothetical protein